MHRRPRTLTTVLTVAALGLPALAMPATAGANAYTTVYNAFTRSGSIKPCQYSAATLRAAESETPNYDQQYFADFSDAVQGALNAQVGGVCAGGAKTNVLGGSGTSLPGSGGGALPTSVRAGTGSGPPVAFVLLAVLAGLLVLGGAVFTIAWRSGVESPWMADWRHACEEASFRFSGRWAEIADRRRTGDRRRIGGRRRIADRRRRRGGQRVA